jgi:hypothetical protein
VEKVCGKGVVGADESRKIKTGSGSGLSLRKSNQIDA